MAMIMTMMILIMTMTMMMTIRIRIVPVISIFWCIILLDLGTACDNNECLSLDLVPSLSLHTLLFDLGFVSVLVPLYKSSIFSSILPILVSIHNK